MMPDAIKAFLLELSVDPDMIDEIQFSWSRNDPTPAELTIRMSPNSEDVMVEIHKVLQ